MAAKVAGDQPPRSETTVARRSGPSSARSSGSSRTSSLARLAAGGAVTTSTGSASASATQVSAVAAGAPRRRPPLPAGAEAPARGRPDAGTRDLPKTHIARMHLSGHATAETWVADADACLLYTSDAADEEDSVDLGG